MLLLFILPVGLLGWLLAIEIGRAIDLLRDALGPAGLSGLLHGRLPAPLAGVLAQVGAVLPVDVGSLHHQLGELARLLAPTVGGLLAFSGTTALDLLVLSIALFYLFLDGDRLGSWLLDVLPLPGHYSRELFRELRDVTYGMIVGTILTGVLVGVAAAFGYLLSGVANPAVWGVLTGLLTVEPAVGSSIVWAPIAVVLALEGHFVRGLLLTAYCLLVVVLGIDDLLRPRLVGPRMTLHPFLTFIGIFGGVATLGISGLLIGPLALALAVAVLRLYRRDFTPAGSGEPARPLEQQRHRE